MSNRGRCLFFTLALFPISIAFGEAPNPEALPTVAIDRELHFQTSEGADVVIVPGVYSVGALASGLQLIHQRVNFPFSVSALPTTHQENITRPVALLIASDPDLLHIVLLFPGGKALDAIGYLSAVRPRDITPKVLEPSRIAAAWMKQGAGQAVSPSMSIAGNPAVTAEPQRIAAEQAQAKAEQAQAKAEQEPAALLARIKFLESILACMFIEGYGTTYGPVLPPPKVYPAERADVRWNGIKCPGK